ncbi:MAG: hypothetical protein Q7T13_17075 [Polaromonas sp.]|nr:hypothetical protein [Polaromonas sp.]
MRDELTRQDVVSGDARLEALREPREAVIEFTPLSFPIDFLTTTGAEPRQNGREILNLQCRQVTALEAVVDQ